MNRRELLRGTSAGAALLWLGCRSSQTVVLTPSIPAAEPDRLREHVRDAVARLRGVYADASALAVTHTRSLAAIDGGGRGSLRETATSLVLTVRDRKGHVHERVSHGLSAEAIEAEVRALAGRLRTSRAAAVDFGTPTNAPTLGPLPARPSDAMTSASVLAARAEAASSSRIVYRGAYVEVDDADVLLVSAGSDRRQRRVQSRAGVVFAAWRGRRLIVGETWSSGVGAHDGSALSEQALERAAASALEPMTPGAPPRGERALLLAPDVVAAIADAAIAEQMTAQAWVGGAAAGRAARSERVGSELVTITDDPSLVTVGGYAFDDEGRPAAPALLIDRGVLGAPLADRAGAAMLDVPATSHARRAGYRGAIAASPSHVSVAPGIASRADLLAAADLLLEGAASVRVDPVSWTVVVRVGRARTVARGALTGHVHADIELRADVPALLASVSAVSAEVVTDGRRTDVDGAPLWRATTAPWWLVRAEVMPARGSP